MTEATSSSYWKAWFKAALIRAVRTVAQTAAATLGVFTALDEVNWFAVLSSSLLAGLLSILTSLGGLPEVEAAPQTPQLFDAGEVIDDEQGR